MQFKAEQMKKEPGQEALYGKAYEAYSRFCTDNGYHSLPKKEFKAEFEREGAVGRKEHQVKRPIRH